MTARAPTNRPLCPSADPTDAQARLIGVVQGADEGRIGYLAVPQAVTPDLLALSGSLDPREVMRVAAPCAGGACAHFDGADCRLAQRIVTRLAPVTQRLPRCGIRPECRWFGQEGAEACRRCPGVVTRDVAPTDTMRQVAAP
jgi:hypothetical protein